MPTTPAAQNYRAATYDSLRVISSDSGLSTLEVLGRQLLDRLNHNPDYTPTARDKMVLDAMQAVASLLVVPERAAVSPTTSSSAIAPPADLDDAKAVIGYLAQGGTSIVLLPIQIGRVGEELLARAQSGEGLDEAVTAANTLFDQWDTIASPADYENWGMPDMRRNMRYGLLSEVREALEDAGRDPEALGLRDDNGPSETLSFAG